MPSSTWHGSRVVVAGSSGGIGSQVASQLSDAGAVVFPLDLANGVDLADLDALEAIVRPLGHLDAVFYLAGKAVTGHLLDPYALDKLDTVLEANVRGVINLAATTAPALRASRGRFVCANSVFAMVTARGFGAYSVSKAALSAAMAALRPELAPATITDCVLGGVRTRIFETAAQADGSAEAWTVNERFLRSVGRRDPADAARDIIAAAGKRQHRPAIGADAKLARTAFAISPRITQKYIYTLIDKFGAET